MKRSQSEARSEQLRSEAIDEAREIRWGGLGGRGVRPRPRPGGSWALPGTPGDPQENWRPPGILGNPRDLPPGRKGGLGDVTCSGFGSATLAVGLSMSKYVYEYLNTQWCPYEVIYYPVCVDPCQVTCKSARRRTLHCTHPGVNLSAKV